MIGEQLLRRSSIIKSIRSIFEPKRLEVQDVMRKNYEMSYDVIQHEPFLRFPTTTVLQEYFIPMEKAYSFLNHLLYIVQFYQVNLLNLSVRFVRKDKISILRYAPEDRVSFVLYFNIGNNRWCINYCQKWTRFLIDKVIEYNGSYYLPYLPFASSLQFKKCYDDWEIYLAIKNKYDPYNVFSNQFIHNFLIS